MLYVKCIVWPEPLSEIEVRVLTAWDRQAEQLLSDFVPSTCFLAPPTFYRLDYGY